MVQLCVAQPNDSIWPGAFLLDGEEYLGRKELVLDICGKQERKMKSSPISETITGAGNKHCLSDMYVPLSQAALTLAIKILCDIYRSHKFRISFYGNYRRTFSAYGSGAHKKYMRNSVADNKKTHQKSREQTCTTKKIS